MTSDKPINLLAIGGSMREQSLTLMAMNALLVTAQDHNIEPTVVAFQERVDVPPAPPPRAPAGRSISGTSLVATQPHHLGGHRGDQQPFHRLGHGGVRGVLPNAHRPGRDHVRAAQLTATSAARAGWSRSSTSAPRSATCTQQVPSGGDPPPAPAVPSRPTPGAAAAGGMTPPPRQPGLRLHGEHGLEVQPLTDARAHRPQPGGGRMRGEVQLGGVLDPLQR